MLITLITVPAALLAGLALALVANLPFRIRWPVRLALLIPWAMPLAFVGLIGGWFFQSDYGVVNDLLRHVRSHPHHLVQLRLAGVHGDLPDDHLEDLFLRCAGLAGRFADDSG